MEGALEIAFATQKGMGCSDARSKKASAADQDGMDGGVDGGGGGGVGDFNVDHLVLEPVYRISAMVVPKTRASAPFAKPSHAVLQFTSCLELGISQARTSTLGKAWL